MGDCLFCLFFFFNQVCVDAAQISESRQDEQDRAPAGQGRGPPGHLQTAGNHRVTGKGGSLCPAQVCICICFRSEDVMDWICPTIRHRTPPVLMTVPVGHHGH